MRCTCMNGWLREYILLMYKTCTRKIYYLTTFFIGPYIEKRFIRQNNLIYLKRGVGGVRISWVAKLACQRRNNTRWRALIREQVQKHDLALPYRVFDLVRSTPGGSQHRDSRTRASNQEKCLQLQDDYWVVLARQTPPTWANLCCDPVPIARTSNGNRVVRSTCNLHQLLHAIHSLFLHGIR